MHCMYIYVDVYMFVCFFPQVNRCTNMHCVWHSEIFINPSSFRHTHEAKQCLNSHLIILLAINGVLAKGGGVIVIIMLLLLLLYGWCPVFISKHLNPACHIYATHTRLSVRVLRWKMNRQKSWTKSLGPRLLVNAICLTGRHRLDRS